ncbi:MAG: CapA family protein [Armatimonadetes bacterium]|nr:CapA family protein [Armatimonadota bacterium]MDW8122448.1 CapA family protein [Armatimonadota bacterium]
MGNMGSGRCWFCPLFLYFPFFCGIVFFCAGWGSSHKPFVRILFGGDVILGRHHIDSWRKGRLTSLLTGIHQPIGEADFTVVNLEGCLSVRGQRAEKEYTFRAPPQFARILRQDGVDLASLANNHSRDFGADALLDTLAHLRREGIVPFGAGPNRDSAFQPVFLQKSGIRLLLFGLTEIVPVGFEAGPNRPGVAAMRGDWESVVAHKMQKWGDSVAAAIAFVHWGTEGSFHSDNRQRRALQALLRLGFDAIVGHHPHRPQGIGVVNGSVVAYSLGNLVHTPTSLWGRRGLLLSLDVTADGIQSARLIPILIEGGLPTVAHQEEKQIILEKVRQVSGSLGHQIADDGAFPVNL